MPNFTISNHKLKEDGSDVPFALSPNGGAAMTPSYLIIHYTAGLKADGAVSWFKNPIAKASAHLVIDRDGSITQMMPFNKVAWHAGKSTWQGLNGLNSHSIGIEIANAGKLHKNGAGKWVNWAGNAIKDDDVVIATHKHENSSAGWHAYTNSQVSRVIEICIALREKYKFLDTLGHEDISPGRKIDPGPAFPMTSVTSKIMGRED
jgi:N-acetylmuramoyl-L-alanine amidase